MSNTVSYIQANNPETTGIHLSELRKIQDVSYTCMSLGRLNSDLTNALHDSVARKELPSFLDTSLIESLANATRYLSEFIMCLTENAEEMERFLSGELKYG